MSEKNEYPRDRAIFRLACDVMWNDRMKKGDLFEAVGGSEPDSEGQRKLHARRLAGPCLPPNAFEHPADEVWLTQEEIEPVNALARQLHRFVDGPRPKI